ncbi:MAG: ABC transporter substrate-binding protein [Dehalococcoidia bacterium]|nr:ABC transporter substrate-binding protein [Dehalococcoidia bacterium]
MKVSKIFFLPFLSAVIIFFIVGCADGIDEVETLTMESSEQVSGETVNPTEAPANIDSPVTKKIGMLSPRTGPISVFSNQYESAANLAVDMLNRSQSAYNFELVVGDSGCDGAKAAISATELIDEGVVGIVGAACSGATMGAIKVAAPAGIPMVSYASTSSTITYAEDNGYLFRIVPSDAQQAHALAAVIEDSGAIMPALLYMNNDYGRGLADDFELNWGTQLCTRVGYDPADGSYDPATIAQSVIGGECDSVVLMSYATDGALIMEALYSEGFKGSVFGGDGLTDATFQESFTNISALDRLSATKPLSGSTSNVEAKFETAYSASGGDPEDIYVREVYDAVNMIATAVIANPVGDIKWTIAGIGNNYSGASGLQTFDANGDVSGAGYSICKFMVSGGKINFSCPQIWTEETGITGSDFNGEVVKIGLLSPRTGPIAVYSSGFEIAAGIAIDALNAIDPENHRFQLITADSGCDGRLAALAAQILIDSGAKGISGAACSGATLGAISVASDAGVPMVSYASTSPALTTADDGDHLFRVVPADDLQARALVDIVNANGLSNPAVLYMSNDYGVGLADFFESAWKPGALCTSASYDPSQGAYDASALAALVIDEGCDSVIMMSYATDGAWIAEELHRQGFKGDRFGADTVADAGFIDASTDQSTLDGIIATRPRQAEDSEQKSLFESAWSKAGGPAGALYTHETYDSVLLIGMALLSSEPDAARAVAKTGNGFDGASGKHTFDIAGDVIGNGYDVCSFSYTAPSASFDCPQFWTVADGLSDLP